MKTATTILLDDEIAEIEVNFTHRIKTRDRIKVIEAHVADRLFRNTWKRMELQESFRVMLLNRNNQLLGISTVAQGGICAVQLDMRLLMAIILKSLAVSVIFAHNHPSGNCKPSELDMQMQKDIVEKCQFFKITVLDHIILTKESYYSFTQGVEYGS